MTTSGLTEEAKLWSTFVASNVKCKEADNPNHYILFGMTLLDKVGFNKINDQEHDVVHGVMVPYGSFSSKKDMETFVAEYAGSEFYWPGHNDWKYTKVGKPFILTPLSDPSNATLVHNSSLEFQGQLELNEQQRRIEEIESMQKKLRAREMNTKKPIEKEELSVRIRWIEKDIERRKKEIEQETSHLDMLLKMQEDMEKNTITTQEE
jgi:cold shock CspA family protein